MDPLVSFYRTRLNLHNATFFLVEHDDAMVACVYKIIFANGTSLILKVCTRRNDYFREVYFLSRFKDTLPVARIIDLVEPEENVYGAVLMECLPGILLSQTNFTDKLAFEAGTLLARIHLNRMQGYGDTLFPNELSSDPKVHFFLKFQEGLSECVNLPEKLRKKIQQYFESHLHLLDSVKGPCLIHRDFRAGNIIVHENKIQGVIDWASGRAGFPQEDFCPLEHGEWSLNSDNKASFFAGYASISPIPPYEKMIDLLRLNKAIATIGFITKSETESKHTQLYHYNLRFLLGIFR